MRARLNNVPALFRYSLTLRFGGRAGAGSRMEVFNAIRELGAFRVRRKGDARDVLDIRTTLKKSELEKCLGELAKLRDFHCRIDDFDGDRDRPGKGL